MQGKEYIIDKIISDANSKAEKIVSVAQERANKGLEDAKANAEKAYNDALSLAKQNVPETIRRKVSVAELEVKKIILQAKQEVIDLVFKQAITAVKADKKKYLAYLNKLIKQNAENNDLVIIATSDVGVVTPQFISGIAKEMGINLSLSEQTGSFSGGVILVSSSYDKNVTLELELAALREDIEATIVADLFK